ncbi:MAG: DUF262 domain-containing protein [Magnetococcales bacterium]|nr:DUF262 domain-containing protein [Magnetococcales bacterium]
MKNNGTNEPETDNDESENFDDDFGIQEYEISSSPNDFNIKTLFYFINSGVVKIPGFQRNYVWDIRQASKLIESIILGIPIPQIFLYEEKKNVFLVIDGQQRYMTIYYFMKERFPRDDKRHELRVIFQEKGNIPDEIIDDNRYFIDFNLRLLSNSNQSKQKNKFNGFNYSTLNEEDKVAFELRTIRNIIIKQNVPKDDHSVIFEVFNRLNTGGTNLKPQEIRASLFHSKFYDMLFRINLDENWRQHTQTSHPDTNMKDIEYILRGFAMLIEGDTYKPSLVKFLNNFSLRAKSYNEDKIKYLEDLFKSFIGKIPANQKKFFCNRDGRFNVSIFESIFVATCRTAYKDYNTNKNYNTDVRIFSESKLEELKQDDAFREATQSHTTSKANVSTRLRRAQEMLG